MRRKLRPAAYWLLTGLAIALAVASLFMHPDAAAGMPALKYPLLGAGAAAAIVVLVRLLRPLLRASEGDDDAD